MAQPTAHPPVGSQTAPAGVGPYGGLALDRRLAQVARPVAWCTADERIREVAGRIGAGHHSCALVQAGAAVGIVTDSDFRRRVATGEVGIDAPVSAIATVPALTMDEQETQIAGLLRMVEHGVHHLVLTDGAGRAVGVVRAVDLAQTAVRDPLVVRSEIDTARDLEGLAGAVRHLSATIVALCDDGIAPPHVGAVHAAAIDAVIRRVLRLRADPVLAQVRHSWLVLGSLARRESLPLSDVDTALVWDDDPAPSDPALTDHDPAGPLRAAAAGVLDDLRRCGLVPCPNGVNADSPTFGRSRSAWAAAWRRGSTSGQSLLMTATLADSRPITEPSLGRHLTEPIGAQPRGSRVVRALLDEALGFRPPTGFVRDFVVEHDGAHSGQLDLKKGGLAPVVALARWVAIVTGDVTGGTPERLRRGAARGVLTLDESRTLTRAFEDVYGMLLRHEADALRAGRTPTTYLAPGTLDTLTRRHLREAFRAVRVVQSHVDQHWMARLERLER
ncbi:putative nucleotidyltransferase substrate binding domain-containing protein [Solwaraspora sp. WMMD1047]|uniref:putative nucleotidyltransferase substrate binding domain-containing protein n=1 Tax=Solwaraspora sp. WMMD1047 TaxID=3016102 RepID=UPI002417924E|nr:putative nucleotidyltransferase substrate binding domain-containing protein [Solwaraspora sp. WMMD1047]MDG4831238.1 putative nucleotidyltransferase substrate binding domain-containing protein [Solwaraspora sp. WMMD1047]